METLIMVLVLLAMLAAVYCLWMFVIRMSESGKWWAKLVVPAFIVCYVLAKLYMNSR